MKSKKMKCQYCNIEFDSNEHKRTREHIIPNCLIELFPEQYITYMDNRKFIDNKGITIADVCKKCNNIFLSELDNYGKNLINNNFLEEIPVDLKDEEFLIEVNYFKLSRWLLKIVFNYERSKKMNVEWFRRALGYILYDTRIENIDFSIFLGLHVNTTPLPEQFYEYKPLQIVDNPKLLGNSLAVVSFGLNPFINKIEIIGAFSTYVIRFGTAIFYIILWNKNVDLTVKKYFNSLMTTEFNFSRIVSSNDVYYIKRVSAHSNTSIGYWHLISNSGIKQDDMIIEKFINEKSLSECQNYFLNLIGKDEMEKTKTLIEMIEFPNNTKIKKKYKKYFE